MLFLYPEGVGEGGSLQNNRNDHVNKSSIFCSVRVLLVGIFFLIISASVTKERR